MHIVTFYSYKGGVGRTMALVNTAAVLAQRDLKVLIVDFDLEAPGISTYAPFSRLTQARGVVEYVTEYIETTVAPKASEFIVECKLGASSVWAMPAGQRNREYSNRLSSIDWQLLYTVHNGYLFFEDLKQQWINQNFDYVLIDSRTGHTDVGGICTRQLPDAVVLMFFPNEQNLVGLDSVAKDIREEPRGLRKKDIILHFCASNVPDLDDEDHILEGKLSESKSRLAYEGDPILIRHYNSLSLLEQSVFVLDRRASRLALEYRRLVDAIVSQNLEDREGALATLYQLRDEIRNRIRKGDDGYAEISQTLDTILDRHPSDGEIAWIMAHIFSLLGDLERETDRLTVAIEQNVSAVMARRRRAAIARLQGRQEDALADLHVISFGSDTTGVEFIAAVELLREVDSNWISVVSRSPILKRLEADQVLRLTNVLMCDSRGAELTISLLRRLMANARPDSAHFSLAKGDLIRALISSGQFSNAMAEMGNDRARVMNSENIVSVFNYAIAEWGDRRSPPRDLMARVLELSKTDSYRDVNRYQCFALAHHICGNSSAALGELTRARKAVDRLSGRIFSCWRYLEVNRVQMREDLDALKRLINGEQVVPLVFAPQSKEISEPSFLD
jgi:cellulose biosynthesis protein BcsQ